MARRFGGIFSILLLGSMSIDSATAADDASPWEAVIQTLSQQVSSLTARFAVIEASQNKERVSVAFHAEYSSDPVQLGPNAPIILDHILTNVGSGYDGSTGYFRSPVSGTYMFVVNYMGAINIYLYVCVFVDDSQVDFSISHGDGSHWDHVSESIVLHLQEGQRVHLKHCDIATKEIRGSHWTTFSGFLIKADM